MLAVAVVRPEHAGAAAAAARELERTRVHDVDIRLAAAHPGAGKWANLRRALEANPAAGYDWLLVVDDDVVLPRRFLDSFLFLCERFGFALAQPAHKRWSNAAWLHTARRRGSVARHVRLVEIGPVTAIHRSAYEHVLPFPELQMGWGLDAHWGAVLAERGLALGIVDATPMRHTRPVAATYPREEAIAEARRFLAGRPYVPRDRAVQTVAAHRRW